MGVVDRNNVVVSGVPDGQPIVFAHGFGCDQHMWTAVASAFIDRYRVVLFDHVGVGASDLQAYDSAKYSSLAGYAADVVEIVHALNLTDVILVGHSVSAMIAALAVIEAPERFSQLVMVGPSARYLNEEGYVGGFELEDIDGLLQTLESNYLGWSAQIAPAIVGNPDRPELGAELTSSFCRADPRIAYEFARTTFMSDNRADLASVSIPTLILQCQQDIIAPLTAGEFVHDAIPGSTFVVLDATGHCPNLSHPEITAEAIRQFLDG
ncbi:MAG: alpha/beta hydrolase [Ilumatobacteraceae bacterium]